MPAGGLIQLVTASGEQDLYLVGDPQITFFKTVYRRHTNFSLETITEVLDNAYFGKTAKARLRHIGDLISNITLYIKVGSLNPDYDNAIKQAENDGDIDCVACDNENDNLCACQACIEDKYKDELKYGWVNALGHAIIKSLWIEIGGIRIDKQYGEWMEIWSELTQTYEKRSGYYQMIGKVDPTSFTATTFPGEMELYIPLNFWFCKNIGLALPIIALKYHNVEISIDFRDFDECWVKNDIALKKPRIPFFDATLLIDYVYLDLHERKKLYESSHIYLIEQLQNTDSVDVTHQFTSVDMFFNHPVKELIWVFQRDDVIGDPKGLFTGTNYPIGNDWFNYSMYPCRTTSRLKDPFDTAVLQINGIERFQPKPASYFRLLQPYYKHTRNPINYIYCYSFSLKPEEHQPTGHINMSKVTTSNLLIKRPDQMSIIEKSSKYVVRLYAINYNMLVISNGMAGLLFNT